MSTKPQCGLSPSSGAMPPCIFISFIVSASIVSPGAAQRPQTSGCPEATITLFVGAATGGVSVQRCCRTKEPS
ncbi:unnamed protein product, partial [Iphiclides podalirius]